MIYNSRESEIDNQNIPDKFVEITSLLKLHRKNVRKKILKILHQNFNEEDDDSEKLLMEIIEYSIFLDNKYYCSFFTGLLCEMLNINKSESLFIGSIIEMMSSYITMQNAMPDIENDDFICDKLSCHKKFGNANTIIASNSLLPLIFKVISTNDSIKIDKATRCEFIEIISKYSGKDGVCGGQMMKMMLKKRKSYQDELTRINRLKISALFYAGAECVELLSGCNKKKRMFIRNYINNFCNLIYIYNTINSKTLSKENILSKAELLMEQAVDSIKGIGDNCEKLINFAEYYCYCIEKLLETNNSIGNKIFIKSDVSDSNATI